MAKEGSTIGGLMDAFGTAISMSLQYGVPLEVFVNKFSHTRFEPMGHTKNPDIRIAKSIVDYIFRWLGIEFLPGYREANKGLHPRNCSRRRRATTGGFRLRSSGPAQKAADGSGGSAPQRRRNHAKPTGCAPKPTVAKPPANGIHCGSQRSRQESRASWKKMPRCCTAPAWRCTSTRTAGVVAREEQFASFQLDAPSCDNCGAITVRNGNCYLCHNCGNSMGCS